MTYLRLLEHINNYYDIQIINDLLLVYYQYLSLKINYHDQMTYLKRNIRVTNRKIELTLACNCVVNKLYGIYYKLYYYYLS